MIKKILLICIILLAGIFAISNAEESVQYPGFSDIDQNKNFFILVGDTQLTSKWEFWRERNEKERGLIINEIYRQDPAFIINLGDLTARGSSEKHWQEFDGLRKQFKDKKSHIFLSLATMNFMAIMKQPCNIISAVSLISISSAGIVLIGKTLVL